MKLASLIGLLLLSAQTNAEPRFAVACTGSARSYGNSLGKMHDKTSALQRQVFVIDPAANDITRALEPRQEFDPICVSKSPEAFRSVSPGLIQARSEETKGTSIASCEFRLDRMSGKGTYILRMDWPDGRYESFDWDMVCAKSEIPVFDLSKRKF